MELVHRGHVPVGVATSSIGSGERRGGRLDRLRRVARRGAAAGRNDGGGVLGTCADCPVVRAGDLSSVAPEG